ncbi:hypothetical protein IMG5_201460 [Ichthyophthirius multifiliis]|uniref:EF-hand domain-containing protein n=1 Tax=Ichthyophthirius multifiliis TaxID=5932 RepID=G0R5Z7_ICHMU|nr:hypothetical protein IMG5_201460 [Ichthyophthirius multifiliis]EGR27121.1 hypothetical protein IMG5_201460 [Ichthyophthirius multifiliis]|eukprot:XP_004024005.1 hypothetical protein IMG5_201460 [Ichthyophthirius multifiliis]
MMVFIIVQIIGYSIYNYNERLNNQDDSILMNNISFYFQIISNIFFSIEFILNIITQGLIFGEYTYFRNYWNILYFIIIISNWFSLYLKEVEFFQILKLTRILTIFKVSSQMRITIESFIGSFKHLPKIFVPLLFVMLYYTIVGISLFNSLQENRCRYTKQPVLKDGKLEWPIDPSLKYTCGVFECPENRYCGNPGDYDMPLNPEENNIPELYYGYDTFDQFSDTFQSIFQFLNVTGWSQTTYILWRSQYKTITGAYFISLIVLLAYVFSNILLASLYQGFLLQKTIKNKNLEEIELQNDENNQQINKTNRNQLKRQSVLSIELQNILRIKYQKKNQIQNQINQQNCNIFRNIMKTSIFKILTSANNIFQIILLAIDRYPIHINELRILNFCDFVSLILFFIEIIICIIGKGFKIFLKNNFNKLDLIILSTNILCYAMIGILGNNIFEYDNNLTLLCKSFKVFRIINFFLYSKYFLAIKLLLKSFFLTLQTIKKYIFILIVLVIFIAQVGRELFAQKYDFNQPNNQNIIFSNYRINYENFQNSIIASLMIFFNEEWHMTMYNYRRIIGNRSSIFYILSILIGQVLFIRLFIGIYINYFIKSLKTYEEKMKEEENILQQNKQNINNFLNNFFNQYILNQNNQIQPEQYDQVKVDYNKSPINQNGLQLKEDIIIENKKSNLVSFPQSTKFFQSKMQQFNTNNNQENQQQNKQYLQEQQQNNPQFQFITENVDDYNNQQKKSQNFKQKKTTNKIKRKKKLQVNNIFEYNIQNERQLKKIYNKYSSIVSKNKIIRNNTLSKQSDQKIQNNQNYSLFIFSQTNPFRKISTKIVESKYFVIISILVITFSCITIAMNTPFLPKDSKIKKILDFSDFIVTGIYALQTSLQIVSQGFLFNGQNSYLIGSKWYCLDFLILIISLTRFSFKEEYVSFAKFKALKILIIFEYLSRKNVRVKFTIEAFFKSVPRIIKLFLFSLLYLFMCGIMATKLLKGRLHSCQSDQDIDIINSLVQTSIDCMDLGGDWVPNLYNYDNIFEAMSTLFMVMTTECWQPLMFDAYDSVGIGFQPQIQMNSFYAIFYLLFFFIGNTCILNMFVGVIVDTYQSLSESQSNLDKLQEEQKEWFFIKQSIFKLNPKKKMQDPKNFIEFFLHKHMIVGNGLNFFFYLFIVVNIISFLLFHTRQSQEYTNILNLINFICTCVATVEILCRIYCLKIHYFYQFINILDLIIVGFTFSEIFITYNNSIKIKSYSISNRTFDAVSKALQTLRLYRIIKHIRNIEKLFNSLFKALSEASSILIIMGFFLYISVIISTNMFPFLKFQTNLNGYDIHFMNFQQAFFTLFRIATSEQWYVIVGEASRQMQPNFVCRNDIFTYEDYVEYGQMACGNKLAYLFFYSYHLMFSLIILNLFIATVISAYEQAFKADESAIDHYQLNDILQLWQKYDPNAKGFINYKEFWKFCGEIAVIYGVDQQDLLNQNYKKIFLTALQIPIYEDPNERIFCYKFHDVVTKVSKISVTIKFGVTNLEPEDENLIQELDKLLNIKSIKNVHLMKQTKLTSEDMAAIFILQKKMRIWRRKMKNNQQEVPLYDLKDIMKSMVNTKKITKNNLEEQKGESNEEQDLKNDNNDIKSLKLEEFTNFMSNKYEEINPQLNIIEIQNKRSSQKRQKNEIKTSEWQKR